MHVLTHSRAHARRYTSATNTSTHVHPRIYVCRQLHCGAYCTAYSAYAPGAGAAAGDAQCELSPPQLAGIQAAMMGRNDSCAYNMTVREAIGA